MKLSSVLKHFGEAVKKTLRHSPSVKPIKFLIESGKGKMKLKNVFPGEISQLWKPMLLISPLELLIIFIILLAVVCLFFILLLILLLIMRRLLKLLERFVLVK